eukprot:1160335-Pelagomonas_calceolata.AAC.9
MRACNPAEDDSSADTTLQSSAKLVYDDSQVNEHPIPKDSLRTIKLNQNSSKSLRFQDSLARRSNASWGGRVKCAIADACSIDRTHNKPLPMKIDSCLALSRNEDIWCAGATCLFLECCSMLDKR